MCNTDTNAIKYESFLCQAFGNVERSQDLAGIADADKFNLSFSPSGKRYLNQMKIGVGYAMLIQNRNHRISTETDQEEVDSFIERVLNAVDGNEIVSIIQEYEKFISRFQKNFD